MMRDEQIAAEVCAGHAPPTLRLYGWIRPAISIGRRQKVEDLPSDLRRSKRTIVWRPTGGGAVLHEADDFTYALALPWRVFQERLKPVEVPVWIHRQWRESLQSSGFASADGLVCSSGDSRTVSSLCFEAPVCGDLLYQNQKVAGSALRVWRGGALIQGTVQGLPVTREVLGGSLKAVFRRFLISE